jgi:hypothetical protein
VCSTFELCSPDEPCSDPARSTCASTVLRGLYPHSADLQLDNLYCAQLDCKAQGAACSPGEVCLPDVLPAASRPFDVCVPKCDGNKNCPPNFSCLQKASSPANPPVCIPGLIGFRCVTSNDCMLGECIGVGEGDGYKICSVPCSDEKTCDDLRGPRFNPRCIQPVADNAQKYCIPAEAFAGTGCKSDSDCETGTKCTYFSPYHTTMDLGTCLMPCGADGSCRARGGVAHTCLNPPGVCYPGEIAMPCASDANCFAPNTCLLSNPASTAAAPRPGKRCTRACAKDSDCVGDNLGTPSDGWCNDGDHTCAAGQSAGFPCTRGIQCASGVCAPTSDGDGGVVTKCTARPGEAT